MPGVSGSEASPAYVLELPEVLDLRAAAPLASEFLALRGRPVSVDASGVRRIGGQCLQVLLSAAVTWETDGHSFGFAAMSGAFEEGLAQLGVSLADFEKQGRRQ
jgi:chemotaxis protein CheX